MNSFKNATFYDILKIPAEADAAAVERAYREALETYGPDSLITYELFSDEQRGDLLQSIDEAFHTLIDAKKRAAYDQELIAAGRMTAPAAGRPAARAAQPTAAPGPPIPHRDLQAWVKKKSQEPGIQPMVEAVLTKEAVSGHDLKQLREAYGIGIAELYDKTRISGTVLRMIENDQFTELPPDIFLRSFLRSYAEILQIAPQRVVEGYFRNKTAASARPVKGR